LLVLTYQRGDNEGTTFLKVTPTSSGGIDVRRLRSGADTPLARSVRSGRHSVELGTRGVAVIGVGAIGSFVADMLIRAGVGRLTLVDDDVVMPGNLIRHLAGPEAVGLPKAEAVKDQLLRKYRLRDDQVEAACHNVLTSDVVFQAIQNHDLVINATADFAVTAFLHAAAYAAGTHVLSAALQNDGDTIRIDVLPPVAGARPLPSSASPGSHKEPTYYEAGCGSPISPTPPHIAIETAAVTVRHAIGLLLDEPVHPSGEIRHLKHTRNQ
jgi:molybdopterin/thiamine biosynthesis adenylyltransferase